MLLHVPQCEIICHGAGVCSAALQHCLHQFQWISVSVKVAPELYHTHSHHMIYSNLRIRLSDRVI